MEKKVLEEKTTKNKELLKQKKAFLPDFNL